MRSLKLLLICMIGLFMVSCNNSENENIVDNRENNISFEIIAEGTQSGITSLKLLVIRNNSQLSELWNEHTLNMFSIPAEPTVDFENDILIAAFIGSTPTNTCMSSVNISSVQDSNTSVVVNVSIKVPSTQTTCFAAEQPFELIKIPRVNNYIEFNVEVSEYDL